MGEQTWGYTILGVFLSITATLCSSLANILIKVTSERERQATKKTNICCQWGWYAVIFLYIGNGLLDFSAFAFAAMSVLAPVSAVTIAVNAVLAHVILKEVLSRRDMIGTVFLFLGAALAVFAVPREADDAVTLDDIKEKFQRPLFIDFTIVKIVVMMLCCLVVHRLNWLAPKRTVAGSENKTGPAYQPPTPTSEHLPEDTANSGAATTTTSTSVSSAESPVSPEPAISPTTPVAAPEYYLGDSNANEASEQPTSASPQGEELVDPLLAPERHGYPPLTGQEALWLRIRAVCFSMICGGIGAWTNQLAKAGVQLIDTSVHGDNQLNNVPSWAIIISVIPCAGLQLKAMSAMMDSFEAVLIIPIYQCVFIFNLILQGAFYFEELDGLTEENLAWFIASLFFILLGIGYLSRSHPSH